MKDFNELEGFKIPIHQSLTGEILFAGVPRNFAILNGTIFMALGLGLQSWWALPIGFFVHISAAKLTKYDLHFFAVLFRHIRHKTYFDV